MKLASFRANGKDRIGISIDDTTLIEISGPRSILELIEEGSEAGSEREQVFDE